MGLARQGRTVGGSEQALAFLRRMALFLGRHVKALGSSTPTVVPCVYRARGQSTNAESECMSDLTTSVNEFLALKRIAVAGVSRTKTEAANAIYRKLRAGGYEVSPVNPNAAEVEGDICYPDVGSIPGGVEGVVIATHPDVVLEVVGQCLQAGVSHVWMHRSFGTGSVSAPAVERCRESGISVIPGGCPMMFSEPVDLGHRCMRWLLKLSGGLPTAISGGEKTRLNG